MIISRSRGKGKAEGLIISNNKNHNHNQKQQHMWQNNFCHASCARVVIGFVLTVLMLSISCPEYNNSVVLLSLLKNLQCCLAEDEKIAEESAKLFLQHYTWLTSYMIRPELIRWQLTIKFNFCAHAPAQLAYLNPKHATCYAAESCILQTC